VAARHHLPIGGTAEIRSTKRTPDALRRFIGWEAASSSAFDPTNQPTIRC
jgi:hypothetical protein